MAEVQPDQQPTARFNMFTRASQLSLSFILLLTTTAPTANAEAITITGAQVFDGERFIQRDIHIEDGLITEAPAEGAKTIDAEGRYIIPPHAEAHTHVFWGGAGSFNSASRYLLEGVFYAACMNNGTYAADEYRAWRPDNEGPDVIFANGGITATECHPVALYRDLHTRFGQPLETFMKNNENSAFYIADTVQDLDVIWPKFLATNPEIVKTYLLESESFDTFDKPKGLSPWVLREIIKRAREENLRVAAHIETTRDIERALDLGVDWLAHLPYGVGREDKDALRLSPELAQRLAEAGTFITPTTSVAWGIPKEEEDPEGYEACRAVLRDNLRVLREAGARVIIGSDAFVPWTEVQAMKSLDVYTNAELLRMSTMDTPKAIYPERAIGALTPGSEASLLILEGCPIDDLDNAQRIAIAIKQGRILERPENADEIMESEPAGGGHLCNHPH